MKAVDYDTLNKHPEGTLFTYSSPDKFVRRAIFELGVDPIETSREFLVYEAADLRKLQEKIEFALKLQPHKTMREYEP